MTTVKVGPVALSTWMLVSRAPFVESKLPTEDALTPVYVHHETGVICCRSSPGPTDAWAGAATTTARTASCAAIASTTANLLDIRLRITSSPLFVGSLVGDRGARRDPLIDLVVPPSGSARSAVAGLSLARQRQCKERV